MSDYDEYGTPLNGALVMRVEPQPFMTIEAGWNRELQEYFEGPVAKVGDTVQFVVVGRSEKSISLNLKVVE